MNLLAVGCSYRTTPVAVREQLAFTDEQITRALEQLGRLGHEAVILSTCNRAEGYLAPRAGAPPDQFDPRAFLADFHSMPIDEVRQHLYFLRDRDAVRHLFRVAASLDSMLIGEGQIAGQVK